MNEADSRARLPWKRFWIPRGKDWSSDGGFLFDPESEYAHFYPNRPVDFSSIRDKPVLILLGEAGIGKSTAISEGAELVEQAAKGNQHLYLSRNLNQYGDENRLIQDIFESEPFAAYRTGTQALHLFLDSFDECRLGIPHLSNVLTNELKTRVNEPEKLFLRIASRSGDWPESLERTLREIWRDERGDKIGVFELCPLRLEDVAIAARSEGLSSDAFLNAVEEREAESLASRPKTLRFLLTEFKRHQELPRKKVELYEKGCLYLCEEDPRRFEVGHGGRLTSVQRLHIAARIAAGLILGNRTAVWLGASLDRKDEDISLDSLVGEERIEIGVLSINRQALEETLTHTGLFRQLAPQRLRFDHQSDAEFLAAWYLARSGMSAKQVLMLLCHPEDGSLVPQLHETAAWEASLSQEVFEHILQSEPDVLLASDVATADAEAKYRLVDTLLKLYQAEKRFNRLRHDQLHKLAHPGLDHQLLPYIRNKNKQDRARDLAIEIAMVCGMQSLQDDLLKVALDKRESHGLRVDAAEALAEIGDSKAKQQLRPFLRSNAEEDPDDRLKGFAIKALWPQHLTAAELFQAITPRNNQHHIGAYSRFVYRFLPESLRPEHLPDALRWVEMQPPSWKADFILRDLVGDIMQLAWEHLEAPGVLPAFANAAMSRFKEHDSLFNARGEREDRDRLAEADKRRQLLLAIIPLVEERNAHILTWHVVREDDVGWLLNQYQKTTDRRQRIVMAAILERALGWRTPPEIINAVLDVCGCHTEKPDLILRKALSWLTHPVRLKSKQTQESRKSWKEQKKWEKKSKPRPLKPLPAERVANAISRCETGDTNAWPELARELTLEDNSRVYEWPSKLVDQPGWKKADESTHQRILRIAMAFLQNSAPDSDGLFQKTSHSDKDFAGGFAFELLASVTPDRLLELTAEDFSRWSPLIVLYLFDDNEIEQKLFRLAYSKAPGAFLHAVIRRVGKYNRERPDALNLGDFDCIWSERLNELLIEKLENSNLSLKIRGQLLEFLLRHNYPKAREYANAMLQPGKSNDERKLAASLLLIWDEFPRREFLSSLLKGEEQFAREVFLSLVSRFRFEQQKPFILDEESSADLYIWLEQQFPHTEDPKHEDAYSPSARDHIADFRNSVLNRLREMGTPAACKAVRRIVAAFSNRKWLKHVLQETEHNTRRTTWHPPAVSEIFAMVANQKARLIRSEPELLDAILESLQRLQNDLQGETPLAPFLWNEMGSKAMHKNENRLSDFIKNHLKHDLNQRGVLVSREVEVNNWPGKGRGESVDLLVQCPLPDETALTTVIEVKGCWNREWLSGMDAQLRKRYLLGAGHYCGIHLVGWYGQTQCKKQISLVEMRRQLKQQANKLSQEGLKIRSFALDASLPAKRLRMHGRKQPKHKKTRRSTRSKR